MSSELPLLVCLMGPTASGKTDLAIELAQVLDCELVSVDSALVYRGLDVGSAKPDYPHHLVDIVGPEAPYSAARFVVDATRAIDDISARGRTPLLVGGTMLYFRALLDGLAPMPASDPALRAQIESEAAERGWPQLHRELAQVDADAAARIHPNHSQRLARALEVYRASGIPLSRWHQQGRQALSGGETPLRGRYRIGQLAICPADRAVLHARIARRFARMMSMGFLEEVRALYERPDLHPDLPALRAVGYRQLWQYLAGECTLAEAQQRAIAATRQLAKRQLTWLRKWPDLNWLYTDDTGNLSAADVPDSGWGISGNKPLALALKYLEMPPLNEGSFE